jgi:metal-responsive CopG/Arc/MetJ family transcriptional regulator
MKTISITVDESLLVAVDRAAKTMHRTRSELCRLALKEWLGGVRRREMERVDREGYQRFPVASDEFGGLIASQPILREGGDES